MICLYVVVLATSQHELTITVVCAQHYTTSQRLGSSYCDALIIA